MLQDNNYTKHCDFMMLALDQARLAQQHDEVPIGAVLVDPKSGKVVASAFNQTIAQSDPTAHAEILAIRQLCAQVKAQRIPEYDLYVTLEPCPMCASAISFARINHVYFGATDEKSGGFVSGPELVSHPNLHYKPDYTGGILAEESATLLRDFFQEKRKEKQQLKSEVVL